MKKILLLSIIFYGLSILQTLEVYSYNVEDQTSPDLSIALEGAIKHEEDNGYKDFEQLFDHEEEDGVKFYIYSAVNTTFDPGMIGTDKWLIAIKCDNKSLLFNYQWHCSSPSTTTYFSEEDFSKMKKKFLKDEK